jgi:hypothetical protein
MDDKPLMMEQHQPIYYSAIMSVQCHFIIQIPFPTREQELPQTSDPSLFPGVLVCLIACLLARTRTPACMILLQQQEATASTLKYRCETHHDPVSVPA